MVKRAGSRRAVTSRQASGQETGAPGRGRTAKAIRVLVRAAKGAELDIAGGAEDGPDEGELD